MHLKRVHMENFKSFGRKLTVPFENGFTGITGPNGSGKSNIGDAILFVLGPNSPRAIRAGRLTDLIFNGGAAGKGASYTLVSLTFDNSDRMMPVDADEVTLTRRVKRTPKKDDKDAYSSYFYVNQRASKKREFVDLLQHARISADGYNITQQGDVLHICQMSNVERRKVLDNIAGVTEFDDDIGKATKQREEVEANLERIGIVLEEIERNLAVLEKEKEAAERHRDLSQEIGHAKGLAAWRRRRDLESQIHQVRQQVDDLQRDRAELAEKLRDEETAFKDKQREYIAAEHRIKEEGGDEARELQQKVEEARTRMVRLEEKANYAKTQLQDGDEDRLPLEEELRRVEREHKRSGDATAGAREEQGRLATELATKRQELDGVRDLISRSDDGAQKINRELATLKQEFEATQLRLHDVDLARDRLVEAQNTAQSAARAAASDAEAATTDVAESAAAVADLAERAKRAGGAKTDAKRLFNLEKEQADLSRQAEDLEQAIRRKTREHAELQAQRDAADRVKGGFGRATETILAARDNGAIKGIIGTIAELANAEAGYETALKTAAGGRMQAIVVEDDGVAAQCIELLKSARAGRATLLPLTKMVPGRPRGQALMKVKQDGCDGFALDLVDYNPRYQNAFWYVFGDTIVATNMNAGRRLMGGVRIVTKDGELFEASGAMVGGSQGKKSDGPSFTNADRGRIDALMTEIRQAEQAQEGVVSRLADVRQELRDAKDAVADASRADADIDDRLKTKRREHQELETRLERIQQLQADSDAAAAKAAAALAANAAERATLQGRLEELETARDEKAKLLLKGTKKELRDQVEALEKEVWDLRDQVADAEKRAEVAAAQNTLVAERVTELRQQIHDLGDGRERLADDIKRYTEAHQKARVEVDALLKMEKKATGALRKLQDRRDELYKELTNAKGRMDKIGDRMETHYGLITNAKAKLPVLEESLGDALVDLNEHPVDVQEGDDVPPVDELRRQIRNLEAQLSRLGAVNMRALDDYDTEFARHTDLKDETDRLDAQRTELVQLVDAITVKKKDALMTVFTAINENFGEIYGRLSMGGKALMELEDPENPFEGGLILKAQPMGKRVTRLDALSGGEKSLTSMAFIFAIQRYEPSPFYYLDEVDQNLDAVNSELLAKLIKDNSPFAQFIVVSLRKVTLKEAGFIYGVTQQTPGQSEVVANFSLDNLSEENDKDDDESGSGGGHDASDADTASSLAGNGAALARPQNGQAVAANNAGNVVLTAKTPPAVPDEGAGDDEAAPREGSEPAAKAAKQGLSDAIKDMMEVDPGQ